LSNRSRRGPARFSEHTHTAQIDYAAESEPALLLPDLRVDSAGGRGQPHSSGERCRHTQVRIKFGRTGTQELAGVLKHAKAPQVPVCAGRLTLLAAGALTSAQPARRAVLACCSCMVLATLHHMRMIRQASHSLECMSQKKKGCGNLTSGRTRGKELT